METTGKAEGREAENGPGALRDDIFALMGDGAGYRLPDARFNELALRVFRFQCRANRLYGEFVRNRGIGPAEVTDWTEIPPVPARAFRELTLVSGDPAAAPLTFRTSGTTRGRVGRGEHRVLDPALYRRSLLAGAGTFLHPEGSGEAHDGALRVLALSPDPLERTDSSLAYMLGALVEEWDDGGGGCLASAEWELPDPEAEESIERADREGIPTLLAGTAFAFVHLLDRMSARGRSITLAPGSVVMETGGFKGRSREVARSELYRAITDAFGVPAKRIVNEYGMTELLSQYWEPVLLEGGPERPDERRHLPPPWMRPRVLHPETLELMPDGEPGILCHLDLANLFSVAAVLTEDLGVAVDDGIRVLGRVPGSEPRGCSMAMEELIGAVSEGGHA